MEKQEIIKKLKKEEKAELLTGRDFWSTAEFKEKGIRSLYLSDGPIGLRKQAAASDHLGLNCLLYTSGTIGIALVTVLCAGAVVCLSKKKHDN